MPTYTNATAFPKLVKDINGVTQNVAPGASIQTYRELLAPDWTLTAVTPYFKFTTFQGSVSSPGSISGLMDSPVLRVVTEDTGILMTAHSEDNPNTYPLRAGESVDIKNKGDIDTLFFSGVGTVTVIGLSE